MDVVAGRVSHTHSQTRVTTLLFDAVSVKRPVLHGDLIRVEGELLRVGRTSMVVQSRVYRRDLRSSQWQLVCVGDVTMVALDEKFRPTSDFPRLREQEEEDEEQQQQQQQQLSNKSTATCSSAERNGVLARR